MDELHYFGNINFTKSLHFDSILENDLQKLHFSQFYKKFLNCTNRMNVPLINTFSCHFSLCLFSEKFLLKLTRFINFGIKICVISFIS